MNIIFKTAHPLLLTLLLFSGYANAEQSLWERAKSGASELWGSTKEGTADATDWSKDKLNKGAAVTDEGVKDGVQWSGDKIEKGADWTGEKAKKGWSATKKGSKTFWEELTSDEEPKQNEGQKR